jgi:hypothetical protein
MKTTNRPDTRLPAYAPAEQIEIAAAEKAEREGRWAETARWQLGCEHADAEGEAY